mgnify:CR=1 FL=1
MQYMLLRVILTASPRLAIPFHFLLMFSSVTSFLPFLSFLLVLPHLAFLSSVFGFSAALRSFSFSSSCPFIVLSRRPVVINVPQTCVELNHFHFYFCIFSEQHKGFGFVEFETFEVSTLSLPISFRLPRFVARTLKRLWTTWLEAASKMK